MHGIVQNAERYLAVRGLSRVLWRGSERRLFCIGGSVLAMRTRNGRFGIVVNEVKELFVLEK